MNCSNDHLLADFYAVVDLLRESVEGGRLLKDCSGRLAWPKRGVYFLFEPGESRRSPLSGPRVVRVGTHALAAGSRTTLWKRLANHRGTRSGLGNHRGSVFRLHIGAALQHRHPNLFDIPSWSKKSSASREVRDQEQVLERAVSDYLGRMTVIWLSVPDEPGPASDRGYIERNAIGLLSACDSGSASQTWLGNFSPNEAIRTSALWNVNHINLKPDNHFLEVFEKYVRSTASEMKAGQ